jgi:hypothetical protein
MSIAVAVEPVIKGYTVNAETDELSAYAPRLAVRFQPEIILGITDNP